MPEPLQHRAHPLDRLGELRRTGWLAIAGKGDIHQTTRLRRHLALHEVAVQRIFQKARQFGLEPIQIDGWRPTPAQIVDLAIEARPVAGIIGIEVDADRDATSPPRDNGIDVE